MIPKPCRANDILREKWIQLLISRMPRHEAAQLIHWAEAYQMLLEIDAADFAYWERIALATEQQRRNFLRAESQQKNFALGRTA